MELSLFDLHCDTAYEMHRRKERFWQNTLAVSGEQAEQYRRYVQVMAIWTARTLDNHAGWISYREILAHLQGDPCLIDGKARLCTSVSSHENDRIRWLLAVEDARILENSLERVDILFSDGVRVLTPLWGGDTCIGGSHDTKDGLTAFGKDALERAASLGILLDVSHSSERSFDEILEISSHYKRPALATHSNAYDLTSVSRNLKKHQAKELIAQNGLIGINLHVPFLRRGHKTADVDDVIAHVEYFLELGAEQNLAIGGDMDGSTLPDDLDSLSRLAYLAETMQTRNYSERLIRAIFFDNADHFFKAYIQ